MILRFMTHGTCCQRRTFTVWPVLRMSWKGMRGCQHGRMILLVRSGVRFASIDRRSTEREEKEGLRV